MFRSKFVFRLFSIAALLVTLAAPNANAFYQGVDFSELNWEQNTMGVSFKNYTGTTTDPITFAASQGCNLCRLRLLVNGSSGTVLNQNLTVDIALAKRIKAAGMNYILDIFYSDNWCDPSQQTTPSNWSSYSYTTLKSTVQSYTTNALNTLVANGCAPAFVQVGNEISNGMLWPVGSLSNQSQFVGLIQAGIAGVKASNASSAKIILHCPQAANTSLVTWFYNTIASQCSYDVVGLSYYPSNGTTLSDLKTAMATYNGKFGGRPIMLVEFAYAYAGGVTSGNVYWNTPTGQYQCLRDTISIMKSYSQGAGVIWWGATYVSGNWGYKSLYDSSTLYAQGAWSAL